VVAGRMKVVLILASILAASSPGGFLATAAETQGAHARWKVLDTASLAGPQVLVTADGELDPATEFRLRVSSRPRGPVDGTWVVTCIRFSESGAVMTYSKDGSFRGPSPVDRVVVRFPRAKRGCSLMVNAEAQGRSARVTAQSLGR
jgi:hypothetical protein